MSKIEYIYKSHNVSVLLYHIVCPSKYRKVVFTETFDLSLKEICLEISKRYEIYFLEIGYDNDHVHFLVQSVPTYSVTKIVRTINPTTPPVNWYTRMVLLRNLSIMVICLSGI